MTREILFYTAGFLPFFWGVAHLLATASVVRGFGDISPDNRRILTMEWIVEGVALVFIGALVATVTAMDPSSAASRAVYVLCIVVLDVLAAVSLLTGFRNRMLPFKLCPVIFTAASVLILAGMLV
jgi:hypothetical protein